MAIFGNTHIGSSPDSPGLWGGNSAFAVKFTPLESGTITSLSLYGILEAARAWKFGVYSDLNGLPNTLLGQSIPEVAVVETLGWHTLDVSAPITQNVPVWLAMINNGNGTFYHDHGDLPNTFVYYYNSYLVPGYPTFPPSWVTGTLDNALTTFYATYNPSVSTIAPISETAGQTTAVVCNNYGARVRTLKHSTDLAPSIIG